MPRNRDLGIVGIQNRKVVHSNKKQPKIAKPSVVLIDGKDLLQVESKRFPSQAISKSSIGGNSPNLSAVRITDDELFTASELAMGQVLRSSTNGSPFRPDIQNNSSMSISQLLAGEGILTPTKINIPEAMMLEGPKSPTEDSLVSFRAKTKVP